MDKAVIAQALGLYLSGEGDLKSLVTRAKSALWLRFRVDLENGHRAAELDEVLRR
jgi:hypothetical protein